MFSNAFSWMGTIIVWYKIHQTLFSSVPITICYHWFIWLGTDIIQTNDGLVSWHINVSRPPSSAFAVRTRCSWRRHQLETFSAMLVICAGIHRSPVNSPYKGLWRAAFMFSLICTWMNGWVNTREAGDLRCHHAYYDVILMCHHCAGRCPGPVAGKVIS